MDDEQIKIDLEDIQDLVIYKKFVRINSDKYTESAFNYVKYLIDKERAILFDADTHRIYTLGSYYGGDELKENLLYFSKLLSIDIDNNILSEIDALQNSDTLAIKGKGALQVNLYKDNNYNTIELEYKLNEIINNSPFHLNEKNEYSFYIDENGKIALKEYIYPEIIINEIELDNDNTDKIVEFNYRVSTSIDLNEWPLFSITSEDCDILEHNIENHTLKIKFYPNKDGKIIFDYSDGKYSDNYEFIQHWTYTCIYGLYESEIYNKLGEIKFKDNETCNIIINQDINKYAYIILSKNIHPIFIDNLYNMQGAWHKIINANIENNDIYNVYITDNSGLGNIEWKIVNKKI